MRYIDKSLGINEKIKYEVKLHWINYITWWFFFFVSGFFTVILLFECDINYLLLCCTLGLLVYSLYGFLKLYMTERIITNKRVVYKEGIISLNTEELKNDKIEGIEVKQDILGKILDYGDVVFTGIGASKVIFIAVDNPIKVKKEADEFLYKTRYSKGDK